MTLDKNSDGHMSGNIIVGLVTTQAKTSPKDNYASTVKKPDADDITAELIHSASREKVEKMPQIQQVVVEKV